MANVVRKLSAAEGSGLLQALQAAEFVVGDAPHAQFAAKGPGVSVTLYRSGKLLVQGKGVEDFAATFLADLPEVGADAGSVPPDAADARNVVDEPIIGTDESGKGDYFGPLVVAAVLVRPDDVPALRTLGVRDSKTMGDAEALRVADEIHGGYGDRVAVVSIPPARYNELREKFGNNLNRLLAWGHARAIEDVLERHDCDLALADKFGAERLIRDALMAKGKLLHLSQRVRAEAHPAVAAASIVARARFLRDLERLGRGVDEKLPKGAGAKVDAAAGRIFRADGLDTLRGIAKLHFRTTEKARGA